MDDEDDISALKLLLIDWPDFAGLSGELPLENEKQTLHGASLYGQHTQDIIEHVVLSSRKIILQELIQSFVI